MPVKTAKRKAAPFSHPAPSALINPCQEGGKNQHNNFLGSPEFSRQWHICKLCVCSRSTTAAVFPQSHSWWKRRAVTAEGWKLLSLCWLKEQVLLQRHLHFAGFPAPPSCIRSVSLYLQHRWGYRTSDTSCAALLTPLL